MNRDKILTSGKEIFLIGIGGSSMSAIALILKSMGLKVSGSDIAESEFTKMLENNGVKVYYEKVPLELIKSDFVCYSSATERDDANFLYAFKNKKCMISRSEMLSKISSQFERVLAVSGTHGKSTASAMLSFILDRKKVGVNSHIGAVMKNTNTNFLVSPSKKYFVTEACEYKKSFLSLMPTTLAILNIELDHTDCYNNLDEIKSTFKSLSENINETLILNYDDKNSKFLRDNEKVITFGLDKNSDCFADNIREENDGTCFDIYYKDKILHNAKIKLYGTHNVLNTLAVYLMCEKEGITDEDFLESVYLFEGIKRRYEIFKKVNGAEVIFDYAHHPSEIEKVINLTRNRTKNKLYVVFQPHTKARTKSFLKQFSTCLTNADELILMPIYTAREDDTQISSYDLLREIEKEGKRVRVEKDNKKIVDYLFKVLKKDDSLLFLGAGDIYNLSEFFKN